MRCFGRGGSGGSRGRSVVTSWRLVRCQCGIEPGQRIGAVLSWVEQEESQLPKALVVIE